MDTYLAIAEQTSQAVTKRYSTSFSLACKLFPRVMRTHIYNIYGLVRVADEIVDTYRGPDQLKQLDDLEAQVYRAKDSEFSTNFIVHAFIRTANMYKIGPELIRPFFASMRQDITKNTYTGTELGAYVYGSAEVVGLMCLRVFTAGDTRMYEKLRPGAQALGAAFQKVNFLRDIASDYDDLGRVYFPGINWDTFDETAKITLASEIRADFSRAKPAIAQLPDSARPAVMAAYQYYLELLIRIEHTTAVELKSRRLKLPNRRKLTILGLALVKRHVAPRVPRFQ